MSLFPVYLGGRECIPPPVWENRWAQRSDTRLQLAHFVHHRPHGGDRKRRLADRGDSTGSGGAKPRRRPGGRQPSDGVHHANPVAKAFGKVRCKLSAPLLSTWQAPTSEALLDVPPLAETCASCKAAVESRRASVVTADNHVPVNSPGTGVFKSHL